MNPDVQNLATLSNASLLAQKSPEWTNHTAYGPVLDEMALYGLAGEFVALVEPHTEADKVALLMQFHVAFGNAIGRKKYVSVEADRHYPNLYAVMVGNTSKARKGTSWGHV